MMKKRVLLYGRTQYSRDKNTESQYSISCSIISNSHCSIRKQQKLVFSSLHRREARTKFVHSNIVAICVMFIKLKTIFPSTVKMHLNLSSPTRLSYYEDKIYHIKGRSVELERGVSYKCKPHITSMANPTNNETMNKPMSALSRSLLRQKSAHEYFI